MLTLQAPLRQTMHKALRLPVGVIAPLGFILLCCGYLGATQFIINNSDDASIILEGQAMLHGNLLMHGWYTPSDSFITTEMPLYALGNLILPQAWLYKIVPALLFAATMTIAALLAARQVAPERKWQAAAVCLTVFGLPIGLMFTLIFRSPMHFATIALTLAALLAYDRYTRGASPRVALALFTGITIWTIIGDPLAELLLPAPVGLVALIILWRSHGQDRPARWLLAASAVGLVAGMALRAALIWSGTHIYQADIKLVQPGLILPHLQWLLLSFLLLCHIDFTHGITPASIVFLLLNGGFLALGLVAVTRFIARRLFPRDLASSLPAVLGWTILSNIVVFLLTDFAVSIDGIRYLFPAFIALGILVYATCAEAFSRQNLTRGALVFVAVSVLSFGVNLAQMPPTTPPELPVIAVLHSHHLTDGIGGFWSGNAITVQSGQQIRVRQVQIANGRLHAMHWHSDSAWYQPAATQAMRFIIFDTTENQTAFTAAAYASFGPPDHIYHVDRYTILAWDHPFIPAGYVL